jgi:hypothetical protein
MFTCASSGTTIIGWPGDILACAFREMKPGNRVPGIWTDGSARMPQKSRQVALKMPLT